MFVVKYIHIQIHGQVMDLSIEETWFMHYLWTKLDAVSNNSIFYGVSYH